MARRKKTEKRELSHEDIPRNTRATARRLLGRMARQWWKLLLVAGAALLSSASFTAIPLAVGMGIDRLVDAIRAFDGSAGVVETAAGALGLPVLLVAAAALFSSLMSYVQQYIIATVGEELTLSLRQDVSAKLNRLPLRYFDGHKTGDIMSRVTNDLEKVSSVITQGHVEFRHVRFGYTPERTLIHDLNLEVRPNEMVAIVGPTGGGKTTLVNLLMRFYELDGGSISIDGQDITALPRGELRRRIGMVLQDAWLFEGTIAENIAYGRRDATREEIVAAARAACCDHFIRTLPQGYDTPLSGETTGVSQGQMQLLTIARAMLTDPAILVLDEATSSVDTRTEVEIQKAMARLMEGKTSFVIAHRLSTIRSADLILVVRDGDIVERGTHRELMARNGFYASLYRSQFEAA